MFAKFRIENFHKILGQILSDFDFPKLYQQKQKYHLGVFENILIHGFNYLRFKRQLQIILSINDYHCNQMTENYFHIFVIIMTKKNKKITNKQSKQKTAHKQGKDNIPCIPLTTLIPL
jgi:hypothetical protein